MIDHLPVPADTPDGVAYRIYNIGCGHPVQLMDFIGEMEQALGREARKVYLPMQQGDVYQTYADTSSLSREIGFQPNTSLEAGVKETISWYKEFYNL